MSDQIAFKAASFNQLEFSPGLPVKGLSRINTIPSTGYSYVTAIKPGCGYVVHLTTDSYYGLMESWARLYVVELTYNEAHATTGVKIQYELNWWPK